VTGHGDALEAMRAQRVIPVIRAAEGGEARVRAGRCVEAGLALVELTTTIPAWEIVLEEMRAGHPEGIFGVGTVTRVEQAEAALDAGATFLVAPRAAPEVRSAGDARGVPVIEAGFTPTELAAVGTGRVAKLFPAHVGGPAYLRSLRAAMPDLELVPSGGISLDDVPRWLQAGAFAVAVGSALTATPERAVRLRTLLRDSSQGAA
jgi:2-dehydro-3-deoxyphosphogluconate aldolase/(4S)-4-hydroxy-2-oxoglutarate aldolase